MVTSWAVTTAPAATLVQVTGTAGYLTLVAVVAVLAGAAAVVNRVGGLGHAREDLVAAARATAQLSLVGLVIAAVLDSWWLTAAFLSVMAVVATVTAGRRLTRSLRWAVVAGPILGGVVPVTGLLLATGLVPLEPIAVVPVAGILLGGAMTATSLAGRRTLDALRNRRGEVEAALSLGLLDRDARLLVARDDAGLALVPGLDQTRTVGLVTLPGAFVGMLLGGATPVQAAAVQLLVLAALLLVQAVAAVVTLELIARAVLPSAARPIEASSPSTSRSRRSTVDGPREGWPQGGGWVTVRRRRR